MLRDIVHTQLALICSLKARATRRDVATRQIDGQNNILLARTIADTTTHNVNYVTAR